MRYIHQKTVNAKQKNMDNIAFFPLLPWLNEKILLHLQHDKNYNIAYER